MLFQEISDTREYGVHVYGSAQESPEFLQAAFLYHPSVVDRSLVHDGSGEVPGRKLAEGGWDLRPHAERLVRVDRGRLESWALLMDYDDALSAPVVKVVTSAEAAAVDAMAKYPRRFGTGRYFWSAGFHEQSDQRSGLVEERTETPSDWSEVLLQGPHISGSTHRSRSSPDRPGGTSRITTHGTWNSSPRASSPERTGNARPTERRSRRRFPSGTMP